MSHDDTDMRVRAVVGLLYWAAVAAGLLAAFTHLMIAVVVICGW